LSNPKEGHTVFHSASNEFYPNIFFSNLKVTNELAGKVKEACEKTNAVNAVMPDGVHIQRNLLFIRQKKIYPNKYIK
jgi:hypothetical protein